MRPRALGYQGNPAAVEDGAKFITDLVTDGPMKTKAFTAAYIVTRVRSEGYTVKSSRPGLERARQYSN